MTMNTGARRLVCAAAVALLAGGWMPGAMAQEDYPAKPITLVIPYAAGGGTDSLARVVAQKLGEILKQPVIAENRPGATGSLAARSVARATPDGYTLLFGSGGPMSINPVFRKSVVGYDPLADFAPVAQIAISPNVLVANTQFPARTVAEFIAMAKARPGTINVGTTLGSAPDLMLLLLGGKAGIDFKRVPYASGAPVIRDVLAGHLPLLADTITAVQGQIAARQLVPIAVGSAQRAPSLPNVPTLAETLPGFESNSWFAMFAPAGTPAPVLAKLNAKVNETLNDEEVKKRFAAIVMIAVGGPPEKLREHLATELAQWTKLARETGLTLE